MTKTILALTTALCLSLTAAHADALDDALAAALSTGADFGGSDGDVNPGRIEKGEPGYTNGTTGPVEVSPDGTVTEVGCDAACDASRDAVSGGAVGDNAGEK